MKMMVMMKVIMIMLRKKTVQKTCSHLSPIIIVIIIIIVNIMVIPANGTAIQCRASFTRPRPSGESTSILTASDTNPIKKKRKENRGGEKK
jgi:hypothetical protein